MSAKDAICALMGLSMLLPSFNAQASQPWSDDVVLAMAVDMQALGGVSKSWVNTSHSSPDALDRMGAYNPHLDLAGTDKRAQSCTLCHTPQNGAASATGAGNTAFATPFANSGSGPGSQTMICLSCHDGVASRHRMGGNRMPSTSLGSMFEQVMMANAPGVVSGRSSEHPVGVSYSDSFSKEMHPLGQVKSEGLPFFGDSNNKLECSTCHDPHSNRFPPYLRKANSRSALCLTCHDK